MEEWVVEVASATERVDVYLARRPEIGSRARAKSAIERGKVLLNGETLVLADAGRRLAAGDHVTYWEDRPGTARRRGRDIAEARPSLSIVLEDEAIVVVDKPAGMLVEPLPGDEPREVTLVDLVADHLRFDPRSRALVVHRIDRDTSGLVLFAKIPAAEEMLKRQFERHEPERVYLGVLRGHVSPAAGTWSDRLVWDKDHLVQKRAHGSEAAAREAIAHYRVVEQFAGAALVEVGLVTGKRNQIRVQAGSRGYPLVGERLYRFGAPDQASGEPTLARQALHAARLAFRHPVTGRRVRVTSPLPPDFQALVDALRRRSQGEKAR